ncbi:MAG: hypothetical protein MR945_04380 [Agathobacter sp.]|nr:hypothetical protein [Agathobacter sp.]
MLKGKTKIELRDVHTREVEVIEEENMVTNALQYIFNPMGYVKAADPMFTTEYVNYYKTLTGGLLLLNKALDENADNISLPGDVEQTGCAVYDQQNSSGQTLRGNFNATESEIDMENRRVKYVYDFDTAEGNGTIACVALTHALGGYGNRGLDVEPTRELYPYYKSIGSGLLRYTGTNSGINGQDRTMSYTLYGTGIKWIVKIDASTDSVYYFTITSTTSVRISRYRANIHTISLFDRPGAVRTLLEETDITFTQAISQQYFSYNYDEETDKLYIVSGSSYSVSNGGNFVVTEIDMANGYAVKQYAMTNMIGSAMRLGYERSDVYCYRGYLYFQNYGYGVKFYIYRQEIGNSANVQKVDVEVRQSEPVMARNGRLYFECASSYSGSYCCYIINTDNFTMRYPETYEVFDANDRQYVPVIGYPLTYYLTCGSNNGIFAIRTDYLATINNLSSPVVKTADKTMKVTYTLLEQ